ncbi:hypothetical protein KGF56_003629 [Candida oxycetoniae]|uniref:Major facilitator superfamily (MFS) profile domain-containing protein n=1 Tax=Candida oxycetoniae TaxID=497107 RepID=A0AAI9SVN5_9ASCO|nr:uncharacterized protein KGF56_003629 [Candida oxycetoniae]KAI3403584.2 hypothetical protein KGF56_003629 [Candida oxycetoniae]
MAQSSDDCSVSQNSMSDGSRKSVDQLVQIEPYEIYSVRSLNSQLQGDEAISIHSTRLSRIKTNQSELSRIFTGIKDDQLQDEENRDQYRERGDAEYILVQELEKAISSKNISKQFTSTYDVESKEYQEIKTEKDEKDEEGKEDEKEAEAADKEDQDYELDGGFAWLMAICAMLAVFSTWGANAAYGVFLNYYLNSNTFPGATEYDFALIGGIVVFLANFLAPISALLYKVLGFRMVCCIGIVVQTAGWIVASFSKKIWHLYLTQGVLVGISFSLIFVPATLILPTWFQKRKATSMGLCVSGAGLGGLIFSLSLNKVIEDTGDQKWALRMVGFVCLATALFCALMMRPRNYRSIPTRERMTLAFIKPHVKVIFDIKVFKNLGLCIISIWFSIALIGYTLMLFSLSAYASSVGLTHAQASVLTAVMNAAQTVGRPSMGLIADRFGRANFTSIICLVISILLYAFWINAKTYGALIAFAVVIGLIVGVGSSLAQPLTADALEGELEKLPAGWSGINIIVSFFCLVAEVIALSLVVPDSPSPYLHTQIFAGSCFMACFLLMIPLREFYVHKILKERYHITKSKLEKLRGGVTTKSGYLKDAAATQRDDYTEEGEEIFLERIERYEQLLTKSLTAYCIRAVYPIKV